MYFIDKRIQVICDNLNKLRIRNVQPVTDPVVDHQPPLVRLNRDRAGADFRGLPSGFIPLDGAHHMPMASPELQIRALADEHIAERRMPRITGPREHHIHSIDLPGKHHPIAVVGQKRVFQLMEALKILRPAHADSRPMIPVAQLRFQQRGGALQGRFRRGVPLRQPVGEHGHFPGVQQGWHPLGNPGGAGGVPGGRPGDYPAGVPV